jgi:uncharacterized protein YegJ (DUF2314 family)
MMGQIVNARERLLGQEQMICFILRALLASNGPSTATGVTTGNDPTNIKKPWRSDPRLLGRFHSEYPDDVKVIVHDGGPRTTDRRPEVVWVRVIGCDGEVFRGQVLNRPFHLEKVKQGDFIKFIVPKSGEYPILVREQYLKERENWIITPCNKCGLSELFDLRQTS